MSAEQLDRIEAALTLLLARTDPGPLDCLAIEHPHEHGPGVGYFAPMQGREPGPFCYVDVLQRDGTLKMRKLAK